MDIAGVYKPKTDVSRNAFDNLLTIVQEALGDQPREILYGAADEVLGILKQEGLKEADRKRDIEALIDKIDNERFADMVGLAKQSHDYQPEVEDGTAGGRHRFDDEDDIDETVGVAVQFEDDEEEEDEDGLAFEEVREEEPAGDVDDGEEGEQMTETVQEGFLKFGPAEGGILVGDGEPMEVDASAEEMEDGDDKHKQVSLIDRVRQEMAAYKQKLASIGEASAGWSHTRNLIDLNDIAFAQGSHLMSNTKFVLPEGTERTNKRSYESIRVPPKMPEPIDETKEVSLYE